MITLWKDDAGIHEEVSTCTIQSCIDREATHVIDIAKKKLTGREGRTHLLTSLSEISELVDYLLYRSNASRKNPYLHIDIESKNLSIMTSKRGSNMIATVQLCNDGENGYVIPLEHFEAPWMKWGKKQRRNALRFIRKELHRLFTTPKPRFTRWTAHSAQFEDSQLYKWVKARPINRSLWCTVHATHLIDENRLETGPSRKGAFALKNLAVDLLGFMLYEEADIAERSAGKLYLLPLKRLARYGAMDVWVPDRLLKLLMGRAKDEGFREAYVLLLDNLMAPTVRLESHLKRSGWRVDLDYNLSLLAADSPIMRRLPEIERDFLQLPDVQRANAILAKRQRRDNGMKPLFGRPQTFKLKNRKHRGLLFFQICDLAPRPAKPGKDELTYYDPKLAEKGKLPPMDKAFLSMHASVWDGKDEVWENNLREDGKPACMPATLWSERQGLLTLRNLFVKKIWKEFVRPSNPNYNCVDGHTRSTYNFAGTVTGRGVSFGPNGQQNPRADTPIKKKVKNIYVSEVGWAMVPMDFRANEVRWGCICSGDKVLANLLIDGEAAVEKYRRNPTKKNRAFADIASDIHKQTASIVFGIDNIYSYDWGSMEAKRQRAATKAVIFGVFYGRGANAIAQQLGITKNEATELIAQIRSRFKRLFEWLDWTVEYAKTFGYIYSPFGRRRRLGHMFEYAEEIEAIKRRYRVWKGEDIAPHMPPHLNLTVAEVRRICKNLAEGGRLAKNSPIQSVASDANNLGASEFLTYIEPELLVQAPFSKHLSRGYVASAFIEDWKGMRTASDVLDHSLDTAPSSELVYLRKGVRSAVETFQDTCRALAKPWRIHAVVHDAAYVGCPVEDLPEVAKVMEHCFVERTTAIAEEVFGVDVIAPLAVEFEFGLSAGDCETWDWTEEHMEKIMSKLKRDVKIRDDARRLKPLVEPDLHVA